MADIELVVKIDETEYMNIKNAINSLIENGVERASMSKVCLSILDGKPLPKGHGRLIDADEFKEYIEDGIKIAFIQAPWHAKDVEKLADGIIKDIDEQTTIIEADKEQE